jgi:hypothetical protein
MKVKIRIKKDRVANIAIMSVPAVMLAPISIPLAVLAAIVGGSILGTNSDDEYEIDLSIGQWINIIQMQHATEEEKKRLETLYWRLPQSRADNDK